MESKPRKTRQGFAILLGVTAVFAWVVWLAFSTRTPPELSESRESKVPALAQDQRVDATRRIEYPIAAQGRLVLKQEELPLRGSLELTLELPDEARGTKALPVVVASLDGRRLEAVGAIAPGSETGVRLKIDVAWLKPGTYMISLETDEAGHFPLRRYVLSVR